MTTDLIGTRLTTQEEQLVAIYGQLKVLVADETLAPATRSNLLNALASTAIAVTGLGLAYEHLIDLGV